LVLLEGISKRRTNRIAHAGARGLSLIFHMRRECGDTNDKTRRDGQKFVSIGGEKASMRRRFACSCPCWMAARTAG